MSNKQIIGLVVAAAILVVGTVWISGGKTTTITERIVGSSSGPAVVDGCMDVNGVLTCTYKQKMSFATSTPCSFKAPAATSTLVYFNAQFVTASTSQAMLAKGTGPNSTTTPLAIKAITTGTQPYITAIATSTVGATDYQFGPTRAFATLGVSQVDSVTTNGPVGFCVAQFIVNQ